MIISIITIIIIISIIFIFMARYIQIAHCTHTISLMAVVSCPLAASFLFKANDAQHCSLGGGFQGGSFPR
jgi:hypothetical protein